MTKLWLWSGQEIAINRQTDGQKDKRRFLGSMKMLCNCLRGLKYICFDFVESFESFKKSFKNYCEDSMKPKPARRQSFSHDPCHRL